MNPKPAAPAPRRFRGIRTQVFLVQAQSAAPVDGVQHVGFGIADEAFLAEFHPATA